MDRVWMEILCTALTVSYATNPYTILLLPKGTCKLCCPYHKDDIKLYINVPGGPEEQYFDWENGTDWRMLNNNRSVVFYVHGFTEQHTGPAATEVRHAYRERGEDNLVVVDWSALAAAPWYNSAVANTPYVAEFLAGVIDSLVIRGLPLEKIHVIGFSLGAEISGLLAKRITVGKLKRVTGLDPALPLYDRLNPRGRLSKTDAEFVDVIHTDGGIFGFDTPMGHADFFPNGGRPAQPGCRAELLVHTGRLKDFVACSHNRAWKYFAESVRDPLAFPAYKCHTFLEFEKGKCSKKGPQGYMGYIADPSMRGRYFMDTKSTEPYGLGIHNESIHVHYDVNLLPPEEQHQVSIEGLPALHQLLTGLTAQGFPLTPTSLADPSSGMSLTIGYPSGTSGAWPGSSHPGGGSVSPAGHSGTTAAGYSPPPSPSSSAGSTPAYFAAGDGLQTASPYYYQTGQGYDEELLRNMQRNGVRYEGSNGRTIDLLADYEASGHGGGGYYDNSYPDYTADYGALPPHFPDMYSSDYADLPYATRAELSEQSSLDPGQYLGARLRLYRTLRPTSVLPPLLPRTWSRRPWSKPETDRVSRGAWLRRQRLGRTAHRGHKPALPPSHGDTISN